MKRLVCALACTLALTALGCGKERAASEQAAEVDYGERDPHASYEPDPSEIPLSVDFERAVKRKIRADNYREELARIERELKVSARKQ